MKQGRFTAEPVAFALKQLDEKLISVPEVSRKMGVSQQTIYKWRNRYAGMSVSGVRKLKAGARKTGN